MADAGCEKDLEWLRLTKCLDIVEKEGIGDSTLESCRSVIEGPALHSSPYVDTGMSWPAGIAIGAACLALAWWGRSFQGG